jgi:hypothetical protein
MPPQRVRVRSRRVRSVPVCVGLLDTDLVSVLMLMRAVVVLMLMGMLNVLVVVFAMLVLVQHIAVAMLVAVRWFGHVTPPVSPGYLPQ